MHASQQNAQMFLECLSLVARKRQVPKALGLEHHPALLKGSQARSVSGHVLSEIVYHAHSSQLYHAPYDLGMEYVPTKKVEPTDDVTIGYAD